MALKFEWDPEKARTNVVKHGVRFEDAMPVFKDPFEVTTADTTPLIEEQRWNSIGMGNGFRLFVVCYTERGDTIRIVSARHATRQERKRYEEGQG